MSVMDLQRWVSVSHNAVVNVRPRLRRHEMIFLISRKLLELATAKYTTTALVSFYISTGNDVTSYFWSTANGISVSIWGLVRVTLSW